MKNRIIGVKNLLIDGAMAVVPGLTLTYALCNTISKRTSEPIAQFAGALATTLLGIGAQQLCLNRLDSLGAFDDDIDHLSDDVPEESEDSEGEEA